MEVNQKELASILGITDRRLRQLKTEYGLFSSASGSAHKKYKLELCIPEYIQYKLEDEGKSTKGADKERQQAEHEAIKKQISQLKLRKLKGQLHEANDVERFLTDMLLAFRGKLIAIPSKIAPLIVGEDDITVITSLLEKEVYEALDQLSEYDPLEIDGTESFDELTAQDDEEEDL